MEFKDIDLMPNIWKNKIDINKSSISLYKSSLLIDHLLFIIHNNNLEIYHRNSLHINKNQTYKTNNFMSNNRDNKIISRPNLDKILNNINQFKIFNQIIKTQINIKTQIKAFIFLKVNLFHRI